MTYAIIDLGTNTFHLLIAEKAEEGVKVLYKTNLPVKLGEGTINENRISEAAFERGLVALEGFRKEIDRFGADQVKATATAAVRSAVNGAGFVLAAKQRASITIDVISGDEEAAYIYEGVKASGAIEGTSIIMDIGGGSTEFIICDTKGIKWKKSFDIGAARLTQGFFRSDPLSKADEMAITDHISTVFEELTGKIEEFNPSLLIGSAGAFETFAGMVTPEADQRLSAVTPINYEGYRQLADQFMHSTHAERSMMEGLVPLRVDMIVMAAMLTSFVLDISGIRTIKLSSYDLKMGVLYSLING